MQESSKETPKEKSEESSDKSSEVASESAKNGKEKLGDTSDLPPSAEWKFIEELVKKTGSKESLEELTEQLIADAQLKQTLEKMQSYECWGAVDAIVEAAAQRISDATQRSELFYDSANAWGVKARDTENCAKYLIKLAEEEKPTFSKFYLTYILPCLVEDDFKAEVDVLERLSSHFYDKALNGDRFELGFVEACLERLSMLYDKKLHLDEKHLETQEALIKVSPENRKALKFFKIRNQQLFEWREVISITDLQLKHVKHEGESNRLNLEKAMIYLFYLDEPQKSLDVLDANPTESLDSNKIRLAVYRKLRKYDSASELLSAMLKKAHSDQELALVHYNMGQVKKLAGESENALEHFKLSSKLWPHPYTLLERTKLAVELKNFDEMRLVLEEISDSDHTRQVDKAKSLLERMV